MKLRYLTVTYGVTVAFFLLVMAVSYAQYYFFIFDDTALITQARDTNFTQLFFHQTSGFWRPAGMSTHKLNLTLFGWSGSSAFLLVSLAVHTASSALIFALTSRLRFGRFAAFVSAVLFLASPWATESLMWISAQFDVFAVFFTLSALYSITLLRRQGRLHLRLVPWLLVIASTALALLYKENVIIIPLLALSVAIRAHVVNKEKFERSQVVTVGLVTTVLALLYFMARNLVMDGLNGPYGAASSMWAGKDIWANIWSYIESLLWLGYRLPPDIRQLGFVFLVFTLISLCGAFRTPGVGLTLTLSLFVAILPTAWSGVPSDTTVASRFAYLPGMVWSILIGFGASQVMELTRRISRQRRCLVFQTAWIATTSLSLLIALGATYYQGLWWRFAVASGKQIIAFVESSEASASPCVYITNLPSATFEGPHIFKPYNISHHLAALGKTAPRIRSDQVVISRYDGLVSVPQPDGISSPCDDVSEVSLTLPLPELRP